MTILARAAVLAAALPLAACGKSLQVPPPAVETTAVFSIGTPATRSDDPEAQVNTWCLLLFGPGGQRAAEPGLASGTASIQLSVPAGSYEAWAVCNYPTSGASAFDPSSVTTRSQLMAAVSYLTDNSSGAFVMAGAKEVFLPAGTADESVPVRRLVSRVGVDDVKVMMSSSYWASKTFVLKHIYVTNVCGQSTLGSDPSSTALSWSADHWYNVMGWHGTGSGYFNGSSWSSGTSAALDAMTARRNINATIADGATYSAQSRFYVYPNPVGSDTRDGSWGAPKCSRIVLEATIGGTTYYYTISLPAMSRNFSYIAGDVVIRRPGSVDPEEEVAGAVEVDWRADTNGWDGPVSVTEQM